MQIKPPSDEELREILRKNAHRHPEKFTLQLPGDRGAKVRIPVLVGNPSGACKMPLGERPSAAWSTFIAAIFRVRAETPALVRQLAQDCLLWPDAATWSQIVDRWAGAPDALWGVAREKCGAAVALLEVPPDDEAPPAEVAAVLDKFPRAVWRKIHPAGEDLLLVVDAPKSIAWSFFSDAMRKEESDRWQLVQEISQMAVPAAFRVVPATMADPERMQEVNFADDVLAKRPGLTVLLAATLGILAGMTASVERDGW